MAWNILKTGLAPQGNAIFDFATLKDYLFTCDYATHGTQVWDGTSLSTMAHGYRLSFGYTGIGVSLQVAAGPLGIQGVKVNLSANQPATGLFVGKIISLSGGANSTPDECVVTGFTTTGTAGSATYYVTQIIVDKYPQMDRTAVNFGGVNISAASTGGTIVSAGSKTCFKVMAVTQLKSGGLRASEEFTVDLETTTTGSIVVSGITMRDTFNGTQFAFDVGGNATTWFMTEAFDPLLPITSPDSGLGMLYYRIDPARISLNANPMPNSTGTFTITAGPDTADDDTLLTAFQLEQGYFTQQVDAPRVKFIRVFQSFLALAGDPLNPSRLWVSEQYAPQVISEFGSTLGSYLDVNPDDGDRITGLHVWNGFLFVYKQHSIYRVNFTGNPVAPFTVDRLVSNIGALSHWTIQETDNAMIFLSERGPAMCQGSLAQVVGEQVSPLFDENARPILYNSQAAGTQFEGHSDLDTLAYCTAANDTIHKSVWTSYGTDGSTTRDRALVFNYGQNTWNTLKQASNFYANVPDENGFSKIYAGGYDGKIYQMDVLDGEIEAPAAFLQPGQNDKVNNSSPTLNLPITFQGSTCMYVMAPIFPEEPGMWMNLKRVSAYATPLNQDAFTFNQQPNSNDFELWIDFIQMPQAFHTGFLTQKRITSISNTNPAVVFCPNHGFAQFEEIIFNQTGNINIDGIIFNVDTVLNANSFTLKYHGTGGAVVDSTNFGPIPVNSQQYAKVQIYQGSTEPLPFYPATRTVQLRCVQPYYASGYNGPEDVFSSRSLQGMVCRWLQIRLRWSQPNVLITGLQIDYELQPDRV